MSEQDAIARAETPATVDSLEADLRAQGLAQGQVVLVHSSLSAMGWVAGGAQAVIAALMNVLTDAGTLVMPAHSTDNSEPSLWSNPAVPEEWWQVIRDNMPAYDRKLTITRRMGRIAELFRTYPDVRRSDHPAVSFAAWGRYAHAITADHRLTSGFGEESPLARVYDLEGHVLLLGVGHDSNTSMHLAEHRADWAGKATMKQGAAVKVGDGRQWIAFDDLKVDAHDFPEIGWDFVQAGHVKSAQVACAKTQFMPQRALVDFAADWITRKRK